MDFSCMICELKETLYILYFTRSKTNEWYCIHLCRRHAFTFKTINNTVGSGNTVNMHVNPLLNIVPKILQYLFIFESHLLKTWRHCRFKKLLSVTSYNFPFLLSSCKDPAWWSSCPQQRWRPVRPDSLFQCCCSPWRESSTGQTLEMNAETSSSCMNG